MLRLSELPCRPSTIVAGTYESVPIPSLQPGDSDSEPEFYCFLSQSAVVFGSNRTHVPMRNEGMRPAFACLKIVTCETAKMLASSLAVRA